MQRLLLSFMIVIVLVGCREKNGGNGETNSGNDADSTMLSDGRAPSGWSVQIGAFSERAAADNLRSDLTQSDFPTYVTSNENGDQALLFRVRIGPFPNEAEAAGIVKKVKPLGYRDAFVIFEDSGVGAAADSALIATAADSLQRKQITVGGVASHPEWSPTGYEIAFYDNEKMGIYTVGSGGGAASRIAESNKQRRILPAFAWSPSGRQMAFVAEEVNQRWELVENLYVANKDGRGMRKLLEQDRFGFKIANLQWSPNGDHIAFEAIYLNDDDDDLIQDVFILALNESKDGEGEQNLAKLLEPTKGEDLNWAAGWLNAHEFLFLSTHKRKSDGDVSYEIRSYDVAERKRRVWHDEPLVKNCEQVQLFENDLIYASSGQMRAVNLTSRQIKTISFADTETAASSDITHFAFTGDSRMLFLQNESLWIANFRGVKSATRNIPILMNDFSVSPAGTRLCFEAGGNLYTLKLP